MRLARAMTDSTYQIPRRPSRQTGFTLVEILVALTILVMAGSALLLATQAAMDSSTESLDQTIAQGIARQYLDEVMGLTYMEAGTDPLSLQLGPEVGEDINIGRFVAYDDTDDYAAVVIKPLVDPWNQPLGMGDDEGATRHPHFQLNANHFAGWGLKSKVFYVDDNDPSVALPSGTASNTRALEVSVYKRQPQGTPQVISTIRRVFSYVPAPQ